MYIYFCIYFSQYPLSVSGRHSLIKNSTSSIVAIQNAACVSHYVTSNIDESFSNYMAGSFSFSFKNPYKKIANFIIPEQHILTQIRFQCSGIIGSFVLFHLSFILRIVTKKQTRNSLLMEFINIKNSVKVNSSTYILYPKNLIFLQFFFHINYCIIVMFIIIDVTIHQQ